jgi:PAS domain S-box-containing protein
MENIKILLVDDDEVDRMAFKRAVSKSGMPVQLTFRENAGEAVNVLQKESFDVIFLDYLLPAVDGHALLVRIRELKINTPVIILTSQGDEKVAVQMLKSGAADYMTKDILTPEGLSLAIRNAIRFQMISEARTVLEKALKESESRYRQIVEIANDIIYKTDHQGNFVYVNPIAEKKTGYSESELLKMHFTDLVDPSMVEEVRTFYNEQFKNKIPSSYKEFIIITKAGEKIWLGQNVEIIFSDQNRIIGFSAVVREITKRKKMEAQMLEAQKEAERSAQVKEQFLANMSHEIRTPMNAIIGFTDLLFKTKLDSEQAEFLQAIKSSGENLLYLINDILDFTKISANKVTFEQVGFSLAEILAQTSNVFFPRTKEKNINLIIEIEKSVPLQLFGDPYRLNQVLLNLISNAIKFTERGEVRVKAGMEVESNGYVILYVEVSDTGIGIPEDKILSIFQSFTQASNETTRKYGGTGLGLSIVKNLVELQGGKISVKSKVNVGSVFKVSIPYQLKGEGEKVVSLISKKDLQDFKGSLKILLGEDNELNQKLAKKVLSDFNFSVDIAINGKQVLEKFVNNEYDIILMDIQMPELDGYAATRIIREQHKSDIPIMAMTAHATSGEIKKCIESGMDDYISKPFKADDLFSKIVNLLDNRKKNEEATGSYTEVPLVPSLIDLTYIKTISDNNPDFIKEMIQTFLDQLSEFIPQMDLYIQNKNWGKMEELTHSLKSSVSILKINSLIDPVSKIEKFSSQRMELDKISTLFLNLKSVAINVVVELKRELSSLA